ncbi:MAG: ParB N-terminal domain-containing protein [Candidatus Bathyarchaeia archaeon]
MSEDERRLRDSMVSSGPLMTPPIFVRKMDDHYEIIDGEQRWLVARELGWTHIPAIVRDVSEVR